MGARSISKDNIKRIEEMEEILDQALEATSDLEMALERFGELKPDIEKLEKYYTGREWKEDYKLDEKGKLPSDLKRGVLSEDGISGLLDRVKELEERLGGL